VGQSVLAGGQQMHHKRAFVVGSRDGGMRYPHTVGLASHIRNGNFDAVCEVDTLQTELGHFELKISQAGHDSYGAWREGTHDDLVLALAVALWYAQLILPQDSGVTV
jgi:hypothetical protein